MSPVWQEPNYGVYMVTGYEEALSVYNDAAHFSSCNAVSGPFKKFSVPLQGDDVSEIIDPTGTNSPSATSSRRSTPPCTPPTDDCSCGCSPHSGCGRTRSSCGGWRTG